MCKLCMTKPCPPTIMPLNLPRTRTLVCSPAHAHWSAPPPHTHTLVCCQEELCCVLLHAPPPPLPPTGWLPSTAALSATCPSPPLTTHRLAAKHGGIERLIHVSDMGADVAHPSRRMSTKAKGDEALMAAFPTATILRWGHACVRLRDLCPNVLPACLGVHPAACLGGALLPAWVYTLLPAWVCTLLCACLVVWCLLPAWVVPCCLPGCVVPYCLPGCVPCCLTGCGALLPAWLCGALLPACLGVVPCCLPGCVVPSCLPAWVYTLLPAWHVAVLSGWMGLGGSKA